MNNKRFLLLVLVNLPFMVFCQTPDTSKISSKNNLQAIKLYNESLDAYDQQKFLEAITLLNKSIDLHPKFVKAYYNRACFRLLSNDLDGAKKILLI